jgi:hypothetical protein
MTWADPAPWRLPAEGVSSAPVPTSCGQLQPDQGAEARSGYGYCPQGHGKSLDPHWSPEDFDT